VVVVVGVSERDIVDSALFCSEQYLLPQKRRGSLEARSWRSIAEGFFSLQLLLSNMLNL
jgi:hypothetical protein